MTLRANRRVAYCNGGIVPESEATVSFRDRGFKYGDAAFDTTRTFGGRIFKLEEHIERLYRSLRYLRIDPGLGPAEMMDITRGVVERNRHLLGPHDDYWVSQRVSRGIEVPDGEAGPDSSPTVIVECTPLPFRARAHLFRDGIDLVVPSLRRVPPDCLSPRAKTHNYLNLILADLEAKARLPGAWAVMLDVDGHLAEGLGSNVFMVKDGKLYTPKAGLVLEGISRATVIELAGQNGIRVAEEDLTLFDLETADEVFLTSTSLCLCGARSVNGAPVGDGRVPGALTERLIRAYIDLVDCDFVAQYLKRLDD